LLFLRLGQIEVISAKIIRPFFSDRNESPF
jgi:hypothetical protein